MILKSLGFAYPIILKIYGSSNLVDFVSFLISLYQDIFAAPVQQNIALCFTFRLSSPPYSVTGVTSQLFSII